MLIIAAAIVAITSAYSLAAINQVYKLNFEWYSQYNGKYVTGNRDTSRDRWFLQKYIPDMRFCILTDSNEAVYREMMSDLEKNGISRADLSSYVLVCCTLGKTESPEYRVKVADIAQRGSTVEIIVSLNSPEKALSGDTDRNMPYSACDVVRIKRSSFPANGRLYFIIKNQNGIKLYEQFCNV